MTTRRGIMLGEAAESSSKGYRSRRLSISENIMPQSHFVDYSYCETSPAKEDVERKLPEKTTRSWSTLKVAFNLLVGLVIWTYAIGPHYESILDNLGMNTLVKIPVESDFPMAGESYSKPQEPPMPPPPPAAIVTHIDEDSKVMLEIRSVKNEIGRLQREFSEKSQIHERDPYKDSRDAELSKIHEVIKSLTKRLDVMTEESKLAAQARETTTTTTIPPTALTTRANKRPPVNIANGNLGAVIWAEQTTYVTTLKRSVLSAILAALPHTKRYQDVKEQIQKWKGPEILLDEQPIRGYGDAYCVYPEKINSKSWFSVGIKLPYANMIEEILIEYVREDLDQTPALRPRFVKIETFKGNEDKIALDLASHDLIFGEDGRCILPIDFGQPADRIVFKFLMNSDLGACVYRIKVFGAFQKSNYAGV